MGRHHRQQQHLQIYGLFLSPLNGVLFADYHQGTNFVIRSWTLELFMEDFLQGNRAVGTALNGFFREFREVDAHNVRVRF